MQDYGDAASGYLPRGFGARQTAADNMYRFENRTLLDIEGERAIWGILSD